MLLPPACRSGQEDEEIVPDNAFSCRTLRSVLFAGPADARPLAETPR